MKKWGILIGGLILCFVFKGHAQTDISHLFSSGENKNIIYSGKTKDYNGSPLVFIEGISDKPQPKDWKDELKIKLFGSMELPKDEIQKPLPPLEQANIQQGIKINSLFGNEKTVLFVPHTNEWNFIIQILNDETISIQEDILFIKTAEIQDPVRNWSKQELTLLEVKLDNQQISPVLDDTDEILTLKLPPLSAGVHKIHLSYLIKNQGQFSNSSAQITLPLIKTGWNLPINLISGIILFPNKVNESKLTFLLGSNQKEIKGAFESETDKFGALFFRNTHLIPASTAIQLNLNTLFDSFVRKSHWEKITESDSFMVFIISLIIIIAYLMLNIIEIRMQSIEQIAIQKKYHLSQENKLKKFLRRTGEIWIGFFLLLLCTFWILYYINSFFSLFEISCLILIPTIIILTIDFLLLKPRQTKIFLLQEEFRTIKEKK